MGKTLKRSKLTSRLNFDAFCRAGAGDSPKTRAKRLKNVFINNQIRL
jgi:hypothetical protein